MKLFLSAAVMLSWATFAFAEPQVIDARLHHLRIDGPREWSEFSYAPDSAQLEVKFNAKRNSTDYTLRLRQQDVKQRWNVTLNGKTLGRLRVNENDMVVYFSIPAGTLADGRNQLRIEQDQRRRTAADDIRVGEVVLDRRPIEQVLAEASVEINVVDADSGRALPARITVVNEQGALQTPGAASNDHLAVRPGIIYTSVGKARFHLPAGRYTIFAGRGFEYSLAQEQLTIKARDSLSRTLRVSREVPTEGYVACDTHVHTLTHSGHGDASVEERMITIAAEGIELPIATDHNVHIDHIPFAEKLAVRKYFTPVIGNEVTTRVGHFNIFPVKAGASVPDYKLTNWKSILDDIYRTPNVKIAILNHPRDIHGGTRPFGPQLHNALVGENLDGWQMRFNGMEVINSGATQTDVLKLFHDWMALLNRGRMITPVGSSDSHDVGRHFVGQGRTYIRCHDRDPENIDVAEAVNSFLQGRVMVSYGLLAELKIDNQYGSGAVVPVTGDEIRVGARVLGPSWVQASSIRLYANGKMILEESISPNEQAGLPRGVKWARNWRLPKPKHDVHLVAIALGPGIDGLYWKTAKPYQPTSPDWEAHVVGCSGPIWLDVDGDGRRTSAYEYAHRLMARSGGDLAKLLDLLADYDEAVAAQASHLYQSTEGSLLVADAQALISQSTSDTKNGIRAYLNAWRETQMARSGR